MRRVLAPYVANERVLGIRHFSKQSNDTFSPTPVCVDLLPTRSQLGGQGTRGWMSSAGRRPSEDRQHSEKRPPAGLRLQSDAVLIVIVVLKIIGRDDLIDHVNDAVVENACDDTLSGSGKSPVEDSIPGLGDVEQNLLLQAAKSLGYSLDPAETHCFLGNIMDRARPRPPVLHGSPIQPPLVSPAPSRHDHDSDQTDDIDGRPGPTDGGPPIEPPD